MSRPREGGNSGATPREAAFRAPRLRTGQGVPGGDIWAVQTEIPAGALGSPVLANEAVFDEIVGMDIRRTPRYGNLHGEDIALSLQGQRLELVVSDPNTFTNGTVARCRHIVEDGTVDIDAAIVLITQARKYIQQRVNIPNFEGEKWPGRLVLGTDNPEVRDRIVEMSREEDKSGERNYLGNYNLYENNGEDPMQGQFIFVTDIYSPEEK